MRVGFLAIKREFLCRINCHLITVSSCRRLYSAAIKTPFVVVIKNDIKFNLLPASPARLTVIGNVNVSVEIVFFVTNTNVEVLLLNIVVLIYGLNKLHLILRPAVFWVFKCNLMYADLLLVRCLFAPGNKQLLPNYY